MKKMQRRIAAMSILVSMLIVVGGFCYGMIASANEQSNTSSISSQPKQVLNQPNGNTFKPENIFRNIDLSPLNAVRVESSLDDAHCVQEAVQNQVASPIKVQKNIPVKNAVAPCCLNKTNSIVTLTSSTINDKIKFSPASLTSNSQKIAYTDQQKTHISAPAPPKKPDKLFSVVKIE